MSTLDGNAPPGTPPPSGPPKTPPNQPTGPGRPPTNPPPPSKGTAVAFLVALPLVVLLLACRGETGQDSVVRGVVSSQSQVFVAGENKPTEYRLTVRTGDGPQVVVVSAGGFAACPVGAAYPQCLNKIRQNGAYR